MISPAVAVIVGLSILAVILHAPLLKLSAGLAAAVMGVACVVRRGGVVRAYALGLTGGTIALVWWDTPFSAVVSGLERAGLFAAFLAGLYTLRCVVETSPALPTAQATIRALPNETRRSVLLLMSWFFSIPLAVGALSLMAPLLSAQASAEDRTEAATWGIRGLGIAMLFSPFSVVMALVTSLLPGMPAMAFVLAALPLSLGALFVPMITGTCRWPFSVPAKVWTQVGGVLAPVAVLAGLYIAVTLLFGFSTMEAGVLTVAPFSLSVAALGGRARLRGAVASTRRAWSRFDAEIAIFVSALVFAACATASPGILAWADHAAHLAGPAVLVIAAMLIICLLTSAGIHMAVPAAICLSVLGPLMPGFTGKLILGIGVLAGWSFGVMTALGSISFLTAASIYAVSPRRLAFGPNFPFMVGVCGVVAAAALIVL